MPRLTLAKALTLRDGEFFFKRGQPLEVNENDYHRLTLGGRVLDPDRSFDSIPSTQLKRLAPGAVVTVVRSMGLGDVLMVLPVIRALKRDYPHLSFRYCVGSAYAPLLQGIDFLHEIVPIIEMQGKVSNVIELRGLSERHEKRKLVDRIDIFAEYCGVHVHDYRFPITVTREERDAGRALIGGDGPTIALAVRGSSRPRTWPLDHVREFATRAARDGFRVVVLDGGEYEMPEHPRIVNLTGKLGLLHVKQVLAAADWTVAPDTGLVHLSEAVGTKCLAIYSTTPPALRIGHYRHVKALWRKDLPCIPCWDRGCEGLPCLREITPEIVLASLHRWRELPQDSNPHPFALVAATA
jgi:ADP-heptose:LPS heptosyltransferase